MTAYCDEANLNVIYGKANIQRWADLDNERNSLTISARITWACNFATEYVNSRLQGGHYAVPFAAVPPLIEDLTGMYAGILLYDGRQVVSSDDKDMMSRHRRDFDRFMRQIFKGQIRLFDGTGSAIDIQDETSPAVVEDTSGDTEDWETLIL